MIMAIITLRYGNYTYYTVYRSRLLIFGISCVILLSCLFLDEFEGTANISVAIEPGSTVSPGRCTLSLKDFGEFLSYWLLTFNHHMEVLAL